MITEKQSHELKDHIWNQCGVGVELASRDIDPIVVMYINEAINKFVASENISNVCVSEGQAEWIKKAIASEHPDIVHTDSILMKAIFGTIDKHVQPAINEPRQYFLKNIIAFICLMKDSEFPDLHPNAVLEKFSRFCLSHKADEYKWGIHPGLYGKIYRYFDMWDIELDTGEKLAKKHYASDRRWATENTENMDTDDETDNS